MRKLKETKTFWIYDAQFDLYSVFILEILSQKSTWGYDIKKQIEKIMRQAFPTFEFKISSLYTILRRLEKNFGFIETNKSINTKNKTERDKTRKYFQITAKGREGLEEARIQWEKLISVYNAAQKELFN